MFVRIKEKNSGLFVGFGSGETITTYDLYNSICDEVYKTTSIKDAEILCMILNRLPVEKDRAPSIHPTRWASWEFVVDVQY